jgi:CRP-like cAMP-binding protein
MRFMRDCPIVNQVDETALMQMVASAKIRTVCSGTSVVRAGSEGGSMYLLRRGLMHVIVNGATKRIVCEGQCFGEVALAVSRILKHRDTFKLFGNFNFEELVVRTADVISVQDSELLEWNLDSISNLLDSTPRMEYNIQRMGLLRLQESVDNGSEQGRNLLHVLTRVHPLLLTGIFDGVDPANVVSVFNLQRDPIHQRHADFTTAMAQWATPKLPTSLPFSGRLPTYLPP